MKTIGNVQLSSYNKSSGQNSGCGCSSGGVKAVAGPLPEAKGSFNEDLDGTTAGGVVTVSTRRTKRDIWNAIKCRIGAFRLSYRIEPGVYAVGKPDEKSDVLVSANYGLSFDALRSKLEGVNAWILVIDTDGINVWCAAGKGTFGTEELVQRINRHGLAGIVTHRRIIVPQLGAPGISAAAVKERTGFRVFYGPVRAGDLPEYLASGYRATPAMRRITFSTIDRIVLTPMELIPAMKFYLAVAVGLLVLFGVDSTGILFRKSLAEGLPMVALGFTAVLSGALVTPAMLPVIPFRSFAVKGLITGVFFTALLVHGTGILPNDNVFLLALAYSLFPALSSYLALQFTGATTYTGKSGVMKELRWSIPFYIAAGIISVLLAILYKLDGWGIL